MATPKSEVFDLQNTLNKFKYTDSDGKPLKVDGKLGPKTDSAVMGAVDDLSPKVVVPKTTDYKFKTLKNDSFEQKTTDLYANTNGNVQSTSFKSTSDTYIGKSGVEKWYKLPDVSERIPKEYGLYKNGEISKEIYDAMDFLSQRWFYADTKEARGEISKLATSVRNNNYKVKDCTEFANKQLLANKDQLAVDAAMHNWNTSELYYNWYQLVRTNGKWDYKVSGADWLPEEKFFLYNGQIISDDDFGNINYGYTGTILGFSPESLYKAGGKAAKNPTLFEISNYYSDSEVDHKWIQKGIEQANSIGYYGTISLPVDLIFKVLRT